MLSPRSITSSHSLAFGDGILGEFVDPLVLGRELFLLDGVDDLRGGVCFEAVFDTLPEPFRGAIIASQASERDYVFEIMKCRICSENSAHLGLFQADGSLSQNSKSAGSGFGFSYLSASPFFVFTLTLKS